MLSTCAIRTNAGIGIQAKKLQAVYQAILPFIHFEGQYTEVFWFIK